jgi:hypothetical protein
MQLARHRASFEANPPLTADLTMDEALRVIAKPKPPIETDADYFVVPTSDYLPPREDIARIGELQRHDCLQIFGVIANPKFSGFYRVALLEMYGGEDGPAMECQPDGSREVRADFIADWFQHEMRWPELFKDVQWRDHPANSLPFSEPRPRYGTKAWIEQSRHKSEAVADDVDV